MAQDPAPLPHGHTRSVADRHYAIWRSPGRFTKNPDLVQAPDGRLLLVYSDNDAHWSRVDQILTILESADGGLTWTKLSEVDRAVLARGDERLVTPRLSALSDGRLAVLVDRDDFGHFHEDQPCGIRLYWSRDGGRSWGPPQDTGVPGFEPDRVVELPDGRLAIVTQLVRRRSQEIGVAIYDSRDGGRTWGELGSVAHDGYHRHCEGALAVLDGGRELACVMRNENNGGWPGFVAFSRDGGRNWTAPAMTPFHFHRPYARQLPDGRTLVTGRNALGGSGTYAWAGDLRREAGHYEPGGPYGEFRARFADGALEIANGEGLDCRYRLLPPESSLSHVLFEAEVRVEAPDGEPPAHLAVSSLAGPLYIAPGWICLGPDRNRVDLRKAADMRPWRRVALEIKEGLLTVRVDGQILVRSGVGPGIRPRGPVYSAYPRGEHVSFGSAGEQAGTSWWRRVRYRAVNPTQPDFRFDWEAASGQYPDRYQRERLTLVHPNVHPRVRGWPDHGYSSWLTLGDGTILLVDYTTLGDEAETGHLVAARFRAEDV